MQPIVTAEPKPDLENHPFNGRYYDTQKNPLHVRTKNWYWMIPILIIVMWLGGRSLNADALWYDEWWSVYYAGAAAQYGSVSPIDTWHRVAEQYHELNPPGYYATLNIWSDITGNTPAILRALSLFSGLLTIAFTYRMARDLATPPAGIAAALLIGMSAFFIKYTHEARAYMQYTVFTISSLWAYWQLIHRTNPSRWLFALLGISIAGMIYTHYMSFMVIAATALYHLIWVPKNRRWWQITLIVLCALIVFLPWGVRALDAIEEVDENFTRDIFARDAGTLLSELGQYFSNGNLIILLLLAWFAVPKDRFIWFVMIGTFVIAQAANQVVRFITDVHYLLALFPLIAILSGIGLSRMKQGRWAVGGLWTLVGIWTILYPPSLSANAFRQYVNWNEAVEAVQPLTGSREQVMFMLPEPDPVWIHQAVADFYANRTNLGITLVESLPYKQITEFEEEMIKLSRRSTRMWIAYDYRDEFQPSPTALISRDRLITNGNIAQCGERFQTQSLDIGLYMVKPGDRWIEALENNVGLGLSAWDSKINNSGKMEILIATTTGEDVPPNTYSVSLQLENENNEIVHQVDVPLATTKLGCIPLAIPLDTLTSGHYMLYGVVYDWQTGDKLHPQSDIYGYDENTERLRLYGFDVE